MWNKQIRLIPLIEEFPSWLVKGFSDDFAKVTKKGFSMTSEKAERAFKNCVRQAQLFLYQQGKAKNGEIDWEKTGQEYLEDFKKWNKNSYEY